MFLFESDFDKVYFLSYSNEISSKTKEYYDNFEDDLMILRLRETRE